MTLFGFLIFLAMLGGTGALLAAGIVALTAWSILCPPRMTDGKAVYRLRRLSPGDFGLAFETQWFSVRTARGLPLKMASWWIPAAKSSDRTVVLIHGYADAKVGSIAWAPLLNRVGLNVLAIDLRAHGESEGKFCTGGVLERDEVSQVIDQLLASRPDQTRNLLLFGVSLGAIVSTAVAAVRDDLAGVVLDSPPADYARAIDAHAALVRSSRGPLLKLSIVLAQRIAGIQFHVARPVDLLPCVRCPVLVVLGDADDLLGNTDFGAIVDALRVQSKLQPLSRLHIVPGAGHLLAMETDPAGYELAVANFVAALQQVPADIAE